jgi:putative transposase
MDKLKHIRTDPDIIVYGLYLYFSSRSYRFASKSLEPIARRTHVSIWKWVQKYSKLADRFKVNRHLVKEIFVDETMLKINGQDYWLWVAYEPNLNTCLMMHLSRERTIFLRKLQKRYGKKTICTDDARWHNDACKWLTIEHLVYDTGFKNLMERFVQQIKDTTECFDNHFPCRKQNCNRQHVWNWLKLFILYMHIDKDRTQFIMFLLIQGR